MINVVAASGGEAAWTSLLDRYRTTANPQEKVRYLYSLAQSDYPALLRRTLELCVSDEVRNQDAPFLVSMVVANRHGGGDAWDWVAANWDTLLDRYPANLIVRVLEGITAIVDPDVAGRVRDFLATARLPVGGPRVAQLLERMGINAAFAQRVGPGLGDALR